jgi:FKBP-type peptidyl-prolyl cis-trans isomerase 2
MCEEEYERVPMKFTKLAFAATALMATAALPGAAFAQDVAVGATVYGPQGEAVGTVTSVAGGVVTVDTGAHKAPLPADAFGKGDKGPTITVTKAQIDEMMAQQLAAANARRDAALVAGAAVVSPKGAALGTVKSVEGDAVVLETAEGPVQLKREHFAIDANGALEALFTLEQIKAAAAGGATGEPATGE